VKKENSTLESSIVHRSDPFYIRDWYRRNVPQSRRGARSLRLKRDYKRKRKKKDCPLPSATAVYSHSMENVVTRVNVIPFDRSVVRWTTKKTKKKKEKKNNEESEREVDAD